MQLKNIFSKPANSQETKKFGAFEGVFPPTLLTILGAVMYLRTGWVVGEAGLLGTLKPPGGFPRNIEKIPITFTGSLWILNIIRQKAP